MELRIEQACPQCGAPVELAETDRLLTCTFCGVRNHLEGRRPFRYVLPAAGLPRTDRCSTLLPAFQGTIFLVSGETISHRVVDTTPAAFLPPSLGVRPQTMRLRRLDPDTGHRYLEQSLAASAVLAKAALVSNQTGQADLLTAPTSARA